MNTEIENHAQILAEKIRRLESVTDLNRILFGEKNSARQIKTYFHINRLAYRHFHSKEGFMHFRVSKDGEYHDSDVRYQPDAVETRLPRFGRALELGFGQGANIFYLAKRRPDAFFCGVDIAPTNPPHKLDNLRLLQRDYSDLSNFPSNCFDVVYGIETIVYVTRKDPVFREVFRVLKPGGAFIVYDYALLKAFEAYDKTWQTVISLISKGGAGAVIESQEQWESHFRDAGFQKLREANLGRETLPDLARLERKASRILNRPGLSKLVFRLLPDLFMNNIILGYLGADAGLAGLITYMEWIYEKG